MTRTASIERVSAGDIEVGDRVAVAPAHEFVEVLAVERLVVSVRLRYADGCLAIPRAEARWWRELTPVAFTSDAEGVRVGPAAS